MEPMSLHALIRQKLADGRLPHNSIPRVWGGPSHAEVCDACEGKIGPNQFVMECISVAQGKQALQFHVECLNICDKERDVPGR